MDVEISGIKIYLISLEHSEKRRAQMVESLARLGLDYIHGFKRWMALKIGAVWFQVSI